MFKKIISLFYRPRLTPSQIFERNNWKLPRSSRNVEVCPRCSFETYTQHSPDDVKRCYFCLYPIVAGLSMPNHALNVPVAPIREGWREDLLKSTPGLPPFNMDFAIVKRDV